MSIRRNFTPPLPTEAEPTNQSYDALDEAGKGEVDSIIFFGLRDHIVAALNANNTDKTSLEKALVTVVAALNAKTTVTNDPAASALVEEFIQQRRTIVVADQDLRASFSTLHKAGKAKLADLKQYTETMEKIIALDGIQVPKVPLNLPALSGQKIPD